MSNHPPHIIDHNGNMMPSSFIPFCAIGNNMSAVGRTAENFSLPVCDAFKHKLLDGQLCYQLDMRDDTVSISQGPLGGLKFVMDYNEERNVNVDNLETGQEISKEEELKGLIGLERTLNNGNDAKIYIETIEAFHAYGGGSYMMSAAKEVVGTDEYVDIAESSDLCQDRISISNCAAIDFVRTALDKCHCTPFGLKLAFEKLVSYIFFRLHVFCLCLF